MLYEALDVIGYMAPNCLDKFGNLKEFKSRIEVSHREYFKCSTEATHSCFFQNPRVNFTIDHHTYEFSDLASSSVPLVNLSKTNS